MALHKIEYEEGKKIINDAMKLSYADLLRCVQTFTVWNVIALSKANQQDPLEAIVGILQIIEMGVYNIIKNNYETKKVS